jgi:glutamate dehydrogenase/glutamate dehydrogenase (NAD(P)+)
MDLIHYSEIQQIDEDYCNCSRDLLMKVYRNLGLSDEERKLLSNPKRTISVSFPVSLENGVVYVQGYRVQYNNARGPYKGGMIYHPDLTVTHLSELAYLMALKCALANIPFGGSKGGLVINPKEYSDRELELITREYIREIYEFIGPFKDIPAPDVYTNERVMAWMLEEFEKLRKERCPAAITGKPVSLGGIKLREYSTGLGGAIQLEEFYMANSMSLKGSKAIVIGFGNAGSWSARFLKEKGVDVVGVADSKGGIWDEKGIDVWKLVKHKKETGTVRGFSGTKSIDLEELITRECDILVPAALSKQINSKNVRDIKAHIILEIGNAAISTEADDHLVRNGIHVIPDISANAGGVIASYLEWRYGIRGSIPDEEKIRSEFYGIVRSMFHAMYKRSMKEQIPLRLAAHTVAVQRILEAERARGNLS